MTIDPNRDRCADGLIRASRTPTWSGRGHYLVLGSEVLRVIGLMTLSQQGPAPRPDRTKEIKDAFDRLERLES